ncbi:alpha/beta fold hydrolase [Allosaccharopolyspora coralli]|uniref:Alpha/beta fold hydrolase n=2 Tax=Allosaccharopolyspora coralli TaxID=2665642 RepID=A0A5Q3QEY1_9PSEU|nr:alpha/beta fold hydrolase [Allosaccharopolyspora coralli]
MTSTRLVGAVAGALLLAVQPLAAIAAPPESLALPEPTGDHEVGVRTLHLVDESGQDPWVSSARRELMVDLWYPAAGEPDGDTKQYMTPEESRLFLELQGEQAPLPEDLPKDVLSTVRTNAHPDAQALPSGQGLPLVVLSPGFSHPRAALSGMAEALASHGYAVALIGHNYESAGTEFPDGRVTECVACDDMANVPRVPGVRARDTSFVLDRLAEHEAALIDEERVAMVGHSIGGAAASEAMSRDERIDAGVNLDGTVYDPLEAPLDRPFLLLGSGAHAPHGIDPTWDETWEQLTGWKRWTTLNGAGHSTMTDLTMLRDQAELPRPNPLPGARGAELGNEVVTAFVGTHLRGEDHPLLEKETPERPELLFWHVDRPELPGR